MSGSEKKKEALKLFGTETAYLCVFAIGVSFIGWLTENIFRLVTHGVIDSRYHILPFIWPYGGAFFAFHALLRSTDDVAFFGKRLFKKQTKKSKLYSNLISVISLCVGVFLSELIVGNLWDKLFGVKLWNYTKMPFHVTRYAGLYTSLGFGVGAYLLFKYPYQPIMRFIKTKIGYKASVVIAWTVGVPIVLDALFMMGRIVLFGKAGSWWRFKLW